MATIILSAAGRTPVRSSNLHSVGYNPFAAVLTIAFHGDRIYQYFGVPPSAYLGLMRADSHGRFFHTNIKGLYDYRRIR